MDIKTAPTLLSTAPALAGCAGSVRGREHARLGRPNQDAFFLAAGPAGVCAVVADGCGDAPHSGVGAHLIARYLGVWTPRFLTADADPRRGLSRLLNGLARYLERVVAPLAGGRGEAARVQAVHDHLLSTFLVALIAPSRALVFGAGDGLVVIDGAPRVLDPGPDNAPDYFAYRLLDDAWLAAPRAGAVRVHLDRAGEGPLDLILATDGAQPLLRQPAALLAPLRDRPRLFDNPSLLQKRLNTLAAQGTFLDDATVVAVRRRTP